MRITIRIILFFAFLLLAFSPVKGMAAQARPPAPDEATQKILQEAEEAYQAKRYAEAKTKLQPLAEKKIPQAAYALGHMAATGEGGFRDLKTAEKWWLVAAESNFAPAEYNLGFLYIGKALGGSDPVKARDYWSRAAQHGYLDALYPLSMMMVDGLGGPKDLPGAAKNLKVIADKGHPRAQYELGRLYMDGRGVKRDMKQARQWFEKASANGVAEAADALAALSGSLDKK